MRPSRPARGAWIETLECDYASVDVASRPARGAWIETLRMQYAAEWETSRPARGAWIETSDWDSAWIEVVAPRAGRVD